MKSIYITVVGMHHYDAGAMVAPGMILRCRKEPKNRYDGEAIRVDLPVFGKVGYVGNSPHTVLRGTYSAGRLYDKVGKKCYVRVIRMFPSSAVCVLLKGDKTLLKTAWERTLEMMGKKNRDKWTNRIFEYDAPITSGTMGDVTKEEEAQEKGFFQELEVEKERLAHEFVVDAATLAKWLAEDAAKDAQQAAGEADGEVVEAEPERVKSKKKAKKRTAKK